MDVPSKTEVLANEDLQKMLVGKKFVLSCGHRATIGHNFCHSCYL